MQAGGQEFDSPHLHHEIDSLYMGLELRWLERTPDKREVDGSNPFKPTINITKDVEVICTLKTEQRENDKATIGN